MTSDSRIPPADTCVLRDMLDKWAGLTPDKVFVAFESGEEWTYAQFCERVRRRAAALRALGVRQSDHVLVWLPNGPEILVSWFAINYLGAVYVPINTAYRGGVLEHVIAVSDAKLGIVHGDLVDRLASIGLSSIATLVVLHGAAPKPIAGVAMLGAEALEHDDPGVGGPMLDRPIAPWDTQCIVYTSGTTGPSKGVLSSYLHLSESGKGFPNADAQDRHMITLPLFHAGATIPIYRLLQVNGAIVLPGAFDTATFWPIVARTRTTSLILLGVMAGFLVKRPPSDDDARSTLRWAMAVPLDEDALRFGRRFGVDIITVFNMTEVSCPLVSELNPMQPGSCGRPRAGVQARLVDENDCEVDVGQVGELIVRTDTPWAMNHGYYKNAEATARGLAQRLVPHRRRVPPRRGRHFLLRRPHEGRDPPPRREHLVVRGRIRSDRTSGGARGGGSGRAQRDRRGRSAGRGVARRRACARSGRTDRLPARSHGALHDPALRADHDRAAEDTDAKGAEAPDPQGRRHPGHLGP